MPVNYSSRQVPREDLGIAFHEFDTAQTLVGERVLPTIGVRKEAAYISVVTRENMKLANTDHSNGAVFNRVSLNTEDLSYTTEDRGLEIQVTDKDRGMYSSDFDVEVESINVVKNIMMLRREIRVAAAAFDTTNFTGATLYTDNSGSPWDAAGTDIVNQIRDAVEQVRQNTGTIATSMVIGQGAWLNMFNNTDILSRFIGVSVLTEQMIRDYIAAIVGIDDIIVGKGIYDGALEGQDFSGSDIWSDDYALVFKKQEGMTKTNPGLGRILEWSGENNELALGLENVVEYRENQTASDVFRVQDYSAEKIFDYNYGHLMKIDE